MVLCVIGSDILTVSDGININISGLECAHCPLNAPRPAKLIVNTDLTVQLRATHLITVRSDNGEVGGGGALNSNLELDLKRWKTFEHSGGWPTSYFSVEEWWQST